jgi:hypothetical protein
MTRKQEIDRLLSQDVMNQLAESIPGFDRAGLLAAIIESFGGQEELGRAIVTEYQHATRGSMVRQRILDMICRMISQHSNAEQVRPVEEMETAELHAAILGMVPELERVGVRKAVEGSPVPESVVPDTLGDSYAI